MTVKVEAILDRGIADKERVVLDVVGDCDIGKYMAYAPTVISGSVMSGRVPHSYWFPDRLVKAGDRVVLYTKSGSLSSKDIGDGRTSFFYYWSLTNPIFKNADQVFALAKIDRWMRFPSKPKSDTTTEEPKE